MALWLPGDGRVDRGIEEGVIGTCAKRRLEIGCVLLAETHIESAGAGDAHAIARFAEIVRQWRDEAEPPSSLAHLDIAGRTAGAVGVVVEREALLKPRPHQRQRQILRR